MRRSSAGTTLVIENQISVDVVICTRDRPESLSRTLRALQHCVIPPAMSVRAIVIDNNSTQDIAPMVSGFAAGPRIPVQLVREGRTGLGAARNAGIRMTQGDWVVMTDDDCLVAPEYFTVLAGLIDADKTPRIIGGRVLLDDKTDLPMTIKLETIAAVLGRDNHPAGFLQGCNMCVARDVFHRAGHFDERFGTGARFRSADDTEFLHRAARSGISVTYDPALVVYHAHGRKSIADASALSCTYQFGNAAFCMKLMLNGDMNGLRFLRWDIKDIFLKRSQSFERGIRKRQRLAALCKGVWAYVSAPRAVASDIEKPT